MIISFSLTHVRQILELQTANSTLQDELRSSQSQCELQRSQVIDCQQREYDLLLEINSLKERFSDEVP
jgi:hypothetical protein